MNFTVCMDRYGVHGMLGTSLKSAFLFFVFLETSLLRTIFDGRAQCHSTFIAISTHRRVIFFLPIKVYVFIFPNTDAVDRFCPRVCVCVFYERLYGCERVCVCVCFNLLVRVQKFNVFAGGCVVVYAGNRYGET